jgi:hypothetical protein
MTYKSRPEPRIDRKPHWFDLPGQHEPYGRGRSARWAPPHHERPDERTEREYDERHLTAERDARPAQNAPSHEDEVSGARGRGAYRLNPGEERGHVRGGAGFGGLEGDDRGWQGDFPFRADRPSHAGKGPKNYVRSDARIREDVCDCLTDDHHVDASNIDVRVEHGEVMLHGHVAERAMKQAAENAVWHVSGVRDVENRLKVRREHELDEEPAPRAKPRRRATTTRTSKSARPR